MSKRTCSSRSHVQRHTRQRTTVRRQTCGANSLCCSMSTLPRIMRAAIAHNIVASTLICNNFIGSAKRVVHRCTRDAPQGRFRTRPQGGSLTHLRGGTRLTSRVVQQRTTDQAHNVTINSRNEAGWALRLEQRDAQAGKALGTRTHVPKLKHTLYPLPR
jgi:hypothetical protein